MLGSQQGRLSAQPILLDILDCLGRMACCQEQVQREPGLLWLPDPLLPASRSMSLKHTIIQVQQMTGQTMCSAKLVLKSACRPVWP